MRSSIFDGRSCTVDFQQSVSLFAGRIIYIYIHHCREIALTSARIYIYIVVEMGMVLIVLILQAIRLEWREYDG